MAKRPASKVDGARAEDRLGRGRLSAIDMLPDECEPDITWAMIALRDRKLPANVIWEEFNERIQDRGCDPISKSGWNRWSVRKAIQFRRLDQVRLISSEIAPHLGTDGADQVTVAIAEMIKVAMFEVLEGGDLSTKGLMEMARTLKSTVDAQRGSAEHRRQLDKEVEQHMAKAAEAIAEMGAKLGTPTETLDKITNLLTTGGY